MEIITNWKAIINNYDIKQDYPFEKFINGEKEKFEGLLEIYPIKDNIFRCFNYFNIEDTKIVIIGQDPYHGPNQATGLCFDINLESGCKYPPSLRNIEKVLGKKPNFEEWASKGVLLLNSSLTGMRLHHTKICAKALCRAQGTAVVVAFTSLAGLFGSFKGL